MDMVYFDQFHQPRIVAIKGHNKTALALIVDVLIIKVAQLNKRFVRFFKPVTHYAGVIIKLMDES